MKKHLILEVILGFLLIGSIAYIATNRPQESVKDDKQEVRADTKQMKKELNALKLKVSRLSEEKVTIENQLAAEKNNNAAGKGEAKAFQTTVTEAFKALYNFTPDSMKERKDANRPYLSDELFKQYFDTGSTYGDSNGVESELTHLKLYTATVQGATMKGLVAVESQSRMENTEWTKGRNIYQVTYDPTTKKITALQNLGGSYAGDIYE